MKKIYSVAILAFGLISQLTAQTQIRVKENAHEGGVAALCLGNNGETAITAGEDLKTFVWNINTGEKLKGALKFADKITAVAINGNSKFYVSGSNDMRLRVVDIEQGIPTRVMAEHTAAITAVCFNPINDFIASAGKDNLIKIWDNSKSKTSVKTLTGNEKEVNALVFSPDGKKLFSGSIDDQIKIWDATSWELQKTISAESKGVYVLSMSSDGTILASGGLNGMVKLWNAFSGELISEVKAFKNPISSISISADSKYVFIAAADKKIMIYNIGDKKIEKELAAHDNDITGVAISSKGDMLITVSKDATMKTWDINNLKIGKAKFAASSEVPELSINSINIKDANNNGIIEPGEKANLVFTVKNSGKGVAFNVSAKLKQTNTGLDVKFNEISTVGNIDNNKKQEVSIPLTVAADVEQGSGTFEIVVQDANSQSVVSSKYNFQIGGATNYSYIMVMGQTFSSATGKATIGAPISAKLKIKNVAKTEAKNIKVNFLLPENVIAVNKLFEAIPSIASGEEKEIVLDFYANQNYKKTDINIGLDIEGAAYSNAKEIILKVKLNEALPLGEDYTKAVEQEQVALQENITNSSSEETLYRGGAGPMKGLNVNKPKEMVVGKYYALIIGIDKYKAPWNQLVNAVNDAKAIETALRTQYKFDAFKTLYNEQANRDAIITELEWLVANVKENDNVFIFYSGHGEYKKELGKGYWVPVDAVTASTAKYISNSDLQTYINGIKSKHTLLVSDACFSGDIFRGNTVSVPFEESEKYYKEVHSLVSRQAITSGGIEPVMDGGKDGHSVFTYYFLKSLNENKSKYFDASQIYTKIKIPVINNSEQTPKLSPIKNAGDEGGQFIFMRKM